MEEMTQECLNLLYDAMNPVMDLELMDIINCAPSKVVRSISQEQIIFLARYIDFPRNNKGDIIIQEARKIILDILNTHPAFRSSNVNLVCQKLATYFENTQ